MLEIIYQDEDYVAINKPHNLLVHRTQISEEKEFFAVQILKEQVGKWLTPCHRLDRKTSGVLLFAFNKEAGVAAMKSFSQQEIKKEYIVLVRGFLQEKGFIDKDLAKENGTLQKAFTNYERLECFELPFEVSRYSHSRYSLAKVMPETGRMHQIRRHMAHLRHYVIGDKVHGECKHNKVFEERYNLQTMLLHANKLEFPHFRENKIVTLKAGMHPVFKTILERLRLESVFNEEQHN